MERRFGFNLDPNSAVDRALIDEVHAADAINIRDGPYPAVNMIARLCGKGECDAPVHYRRSSISKRCSARLL